MTTPYDRYADAGQRFHAALRDMIGAATDLVADDLAAHVAANAAIGLAGIAEIDVEIEWADIESTRETVTAVRNGRGADVTAVVLVQADGMTVGEYLTEAFADLDHRPHLVDALRTDDDLPVTLTLTVARTPAVVA